MIGKIIKGFVGAILALIGLLLAYSLLFGAYADSTTGTILLTIFAMCMFGGIGTLFLLDVFGVIKSKGRSGRSQFDDNRFDGGPGGGIGSSGGFD